MEIQTQSLYQFFNGMGGKTWFTAGSDEKAIEFIKSQKETWESYYSVHKTGLTIVASREYIIEEYKIFNTKCIY